MSTQTTTPWRTTTPDPVETALGNAVLITIGTIIAVMVIAAIALATHYHCIGKAEMEDAGGHGDDDDMSTESTLSA